MVNNRLSSNIEIRISCKGLPNLDLLSKSDTFAVVFIKDPLYATNPATLAASNNNSSTTSNGLGGSDWRELGKTEILYNNNDPSFATAIITPFIFEEVQPLKIVLWDYDEHSSHDYIGEYETNVGRLMGAKGCTLVGKLKHATNHTERGTITVTGTEVNNNERNVLRVTFHGHKLEKKDWFGSSDPYLTISRPTSMEYSNWLSANPSLTSSKINSNMFNTSRQRMCTGPVIKNSLDPQWDQVDIPLSVCFYDPVNAPIIIECWDYNKREAHELIGEVGPLTIHEILQKSTNQNTLGPHQYPLIHPEKQKKKGKDYNNSGYLTLERSSMFHPPSLLEYIAGGCTMNLVVAVDFTGSNGDPRSMQSLHYMDPRPGAPMNQYASAIYSVGNILQEYDNDKRFPAYGFGGTIDNGNSTSHCFPLNLNFANSEVYGVDGLLQAYAISLNRVGLSGPTFFTNVIREAMRLASEDGLPTQAHQRYYTLLLLTDGQMNDAEETINAIVEATTNLVALSIIIIGVGNANFDAMEVLDGDDGGLRNDQGIRAARDIVQFVPFNKFANRRDGGAALAAEVLAELPSQVCQYFVSRNIHPNPPIPPPVTYPPPTNNGYPPPSSVPVPNAPVMYPPMANSNIGMQPPVMYPPVNTSNASSMYPPSTNPNY